jgi:hypothetical protein
MSMRLIVAGSRTFDNYGLLKYMLDYYLQNVKGKVEIVSGGATGADWLGERYAREKGYSVKVFPADWRKYGTAAGPKRNREMSLFATHCIVFWDGKSKGSKSMIEIAEKRGLKLRIVRYYKTKSKN